METKRNYFLDMIIHSAAAGVLWGVASVLLAVFLASYGQGIMQRIMMSDPQNSIRNLIIATICFASVIMLIYNYTLAFLHHSLLSKWTGRRSTYSSLGLAIASAVKLFLIQGVLVVATYFLFKNMIMLAAQNQMMARYGMPAQAVFPFAAVSPYLIIALGVIMATVILAAICTLFLLDSYKGGFLPRGFSVSRAFKGVAVGVVAAIVVIGLRVAMAVLISHMAREALINIYLLSFIYQAVNVFSLFLSYSLILFFVFRFSIQGQTFSQEDGEPFPTVSNFDVPAASAAPESFVHALKNRDDLPHPEHTIPSSDNIPLVTAAPIPAAAKKPELTITSLDLAPAPNEERKAAAQNPENTHTMPVVESNNKDT